MKSDGLVPELEATFDGLLAVLGNDFAREKHFSDQEPCMHWCKSCKGLLLRNAQSTRPKVVALACSGQHGASLSASWSASPVKPMTYLLRA